MDQARIDLLAAGAVLVPLRGDKRPALPDCYRRAPYHTLGTILDASMVGLVPCSLGWTALDCDRNPTALVEAAPPLFVVGSARTGRCHAFYDDHERRRKRLWTFGGALGHVISDKAHVVLYEEERVARAAKMRSELPSRPFPEYLPGFAPDELPPALEHDVLDSTPPDPPDLDPPPIFTTGQAIPPGRRNDALYVAVLSWARARPRAADFWSFRQACVEHGISWARAHVDFAAPGHDGEPFTLREVRDTSSSAARRAWGQAMARDPAIQAERGRKSGEVRRQRRAFDRHRAHELRVEGRSVREVAAEMGVAASTVQRWLERPAPPVQRNLG